MKDDLNVPEAFTVLHALVSQIHKTTDQTEKKQLQRQLKAGGQLMGFFGQSSAEWFQGQGHTQGLSNAEIDTLIQKRVNARLAKDFVTSDQIRQQLEKSGILLEDSSKGTTWKRK